MTLLNYSGGIDSLYCLLNSEYDIVHHCSIINHEGRHKAELKAVEASLRLIRAKGKRFEFIHTTYNYGNTRRIVLDKDVIGFQTGMLMRAYPIDKVIISSNLNDCSKAEYYSRTEKRRHEIIESVSGIAPKYLHPIAHLTKKQLIEAIPLEFLNVSWFCRKPQNGKPCARCATCKSVLPHLKQKQNAKRISN